MRTTTDTKPASGQYHKLAKARPAAVTSPIVPPPNVEPIAERWRVLQRTDGKYAVHDPEMPFGAQSVYVCSSVEQAVAHAKRLADIESRKVVPIRKEKRA